MAAAWILLFGVFQIIKADEIVQVASNQLSNPPALDTSAVLPAANENADDTSCDLKAAAEQPVPPRMVNNDLSLESFQLNSEFQQVAHNRPGRTGGHW